MNMNQCVCPTSAATAQAAQWLESQYREVMAMGLPWLEPHINTNENGTIVFEWMRKHKRFTAYISESEQWYLRSWGPDTESEMEDGDLTASSMRQCWMWLMQ